MMFLISGDEFRQLVDKYLRKALSKGVPPLFVDLKPLYADKSKRDIVEGLCKGYLESLRGPKKCYNASVRQI